MNKKNKLSLVSLFFLVCAGLFAEKDSGFSISPFAGIRFGQQDEFVYSKAANGKEYTLSELNWEQKPMYLYGVEGQFRKKSFHLSFTTESALCTRTGLVIDKDWMNVSNKYCTNEPSYFIQTNLSETQNFLESYFRAEGGISFDVIKNERIIFSPSVKIEYEYSRFVTRKGWLSYSTKDGSGNFYSVEAKDFYESNGFYGPYALGKKIGLADKNSMRLERNVLCTWIGFNSKISPASRVNLDFSAALCPYVFVFSKDFHIIRNDDFLDIMNSVLSGIKISATLNYSFSKNHSVFFKTEYKNLSGIKGESYSKKSSEKKYYRNSTSSGSAFENVSFYIGYVFSI